MEFSTGDDDGVGAAMVMLRMEAAAVRPERNFIVKCWE
jgi:hypothetical protein